MGLVSNIEDVLTVSRANLRGEERMADLIEFSVRLASEESMADFIEAEVIWGLKGSAQFSPVQSSPAHLEFNLNPCQYSSSRSQLQHSSAVDCHFSPEQFNTL